MSTSVDAPSMKHAPSHAADGTEITAAPLRPGTLRLRTRSRLLVGDESSELPHSAEVLEVGPGALGFRVGERVVSRYPAADQAVVSATLCAKIPDSVSDDNAPFAVLAGVAMEALRLAQPTLGECFAVLGLNLNGILAVQLLRAQGCRVLAIDTNAAAQALAKQFDAEVTESTDLEHVKATVEQFARGRGVDGVFVCSASDDNGLVQDAASWCRARGRIVFLNATAKFDSQTQRAKELSVLVTDSRGPGDGDPVFEVDGRDYPIGFIRWTEQRHYAAALELLATGKLDVAPLLGATFGIEVANYVGAPGVRNLTSETFAPPKRQRLESPRLAIVAEGLDANGLLAQGRHTGPVQLEAIVSSNRAWAEKVSSSFGIKKTLSDVASAIADPAVDVVVFAAPTQAPAVSIEQALTAGKHVLAWPALQIDQQEAKRLRAAYQALETAPMVATGHFRRFAPHVVKLRSMLAALHERKSIIITVHAASTAAPWDGPAQYVDLARALAASPITEVQAACLPGGRSYSVMLAFADSTTATIHYFTAGDSSAAEERIEVFCGGRILQLENYRRLQAYGWPKFQKMNLWRPNNGQTAVLPAFFDALRQGTAAPVAMEEICEVAEASARAAELLEKQA